MKPTNHRTPRAPRARTVAAISAAAIAAVLAAAVPARAQVPLITLPSVPWFVGQNVPPNILLTLDDSGSMAWAYAPDSFSSVVGVHHVAFKSNLNPMYYNPEVTYDAPTNASGVPYVTSYTAALRNGFDASRGTVNLSTGYRPEHTYTPNTTAGSLANHCRGGTPDISGSVCRFLNVAPGTATGAYWWTYNAGTAGCPAAPSLSTMAGLAITCFTLGRPTTPEAQQNFANWYSFYRTRNLATVSAAMLGFSKLPADYRIAWQALNSCKGNDGTAPYFTSACRGWDTGRATVDARIGVFDAAKRAAMWSWLERLPASGGTPLRNAVIRSGEYLRTTGVNSPYADQPGVTGTGYSSCRASYNVAMTDGIWNSDSVSWVGNPDNASRTLPDGTSYSPRAPYRDTNSNGLADIAFHYWSTDLQPLANTLRPFTPYRAGATLTPDEYWDPRNDPGTWQRMNSFFVGLGLSSWLTNPKWMGSTFAGSSSPVDGYTAFASGAAWPASGSDAAPGNVYDMWHAAISSRGQFYSVDSPEALVKAFEDLRERISAREAGASSAASTSLRVTSDSLVFATSFSSARWDGTLRAFRLRPDGSAETTPAWTTDNTFDHRINGGIGPHRVLTRGATGGLVQLAPTALSQLPTERRTELQSQASTLGITETQLVRWVLGDTSHPDLRRRDRLLGDLVNSAPLFEGGRDYGYGVTSWTDTPRIDGEVYAAYVASKNAGAGGTPTLPTVYVGSNDGMLHAFAANTGAHRWAFMPSPSFAKLGRRADPAAGHAWFVDGQITTHDVHDGSRWRTILIASMGAGARGLFALDVTAPDSPVLLWEWFPGITNSADADLGHVLGEVVVARAQNGEWVVVFGNGYGSASNRVVLYALNALTGAVRAKVQAGATSTTIANGLSPAALLYAAGRQLNFGYAGDLTGNLWRFDLRGAPETWSLSFSGQPLFTATNPSGQRQPITAKPRIASDRLAGRVLLFGTGRLLTSDDPGDTSIQTVYGVLDRASGGTATRANLTAQTIVSETSTHRTVSGNAVPTTSAGWFLDLKGTPTTSGERVVSPMSFLPEASMVTVSTIRPVSGADPCESNFTSWVMSLSPFTGKAVNVFATSSSTAPASGYRLDGVLASVTPIRKGNSRMQLTVNAGSSGLQQIDVTRAWNPRTAWHQIQ